MYCRWWDTRLSIYLAVIVVVRLVTPISICLPTQAPMINMPQNRTMKLARKYCLARLKRVKASMVTSGGLIVSPNV
jgi:hypothetical protein